MAQSVQLQQPGGAIAEEGKQEGKQEGTITVWQYDKSIPYWNNPTRSRLWPIPYHDEPEVWKALQAEWPRDDKSEIRILRSHCTPGYVIFAVDADGSTHLTTWHYLPDLLMFDPVAYFLEHPRINAIYVETNDSDRNDESSAATNVSGLDTVGYYSTTGSSRSGAINNNESGEVDGGSAIQGDEPIGYALVLRRRDLGPMQLEAIQAHQKQFFDLNSVAYPPASKFKSVLHKR